MEEQANKSVVITQYKWAGGWGPLRIRSTCDECDLVTHSLKALVDNEFKGKNVTFELKPWLNNALYCLSKGAWHPPIIIVNNKMSFNFSHKAPMFDRKKLIEHIENLLKENE